jgi:hypothetical protein
MITATTAFSAPTMKTTKNNKKHLKVTKSESKESLKQNRRKLSVREEKTNERVNSLSTVGKTGKLL